MGHSRVMYIAHPTRLLDRGDEFCDLARKMGYAPINPFKCGEFRDFEGGFLGRQVALEFSLGIQRLCGATGVFGISDGTMGEIKDRLAWDKEKNFRIFHGHDPLWESTYEELKLKYGDLFAEIRGNCSLIIFVGPSAVGKTYQMELLMRRFKNNLQVVKNFTTRLPRDERDKDYYSIISEQQFREAVKNKFFIEHTNYLKNNYGSSLGRAKEVLRGSNGIFALTPEGVAEWHKCRFEINLTVILFKPVSNEVLLRNFKRRGEKDALRIGESIRKAKDFILPANIPHKVLKITGTEVDNGNLLDMLFI